MDQLPAAVPEAGRPPGGGADAGSEAESADGISGSPVTIRSMWRAVLWPACVLVLAAQALRLWLPALRRFCSVVFDGASIPGWSTADSRVGVGGALLVVAVAVVTTTAGAVVANFVPWPPGSRRYGRWTRLWRTTVVYLAAFVAAWLIKFVFTAIVGISHVGRRGDYPHGWEKLGFLIDLAGQGGPVEEPVFVVLPLAVAAGIAAIAASQRTCDDQTHRHWFIRLAAPMVVGSALLRGVMHLYQGWAPVLGAVVWGAVACLLYLRWRSLLGLVLAHVLYNVVFAGLLFPGGSAATIYAVMLSVAVAAVAALLLPPARNGDARSQ